MAKMWPPNLTRGTSAFFQFKNWVVGVADAVFKRSSGYAQLVKSDSQTSLVSDTSCKTDISYISDDKSL